MLRMQEAFEMRMGEFVSRSHERQRYIRLRSQERRLQQFEAEERQRLFGNVQPQHSSIALSEPAVGTYSTHLIFTSVFTVDLLSSDLMLFFHKLKNTKLMCLLLTAI